MLTKDKYILASISKSNGVVTFYTAGDPALPVEYATTALAEAKATELATANPGKKYAVMLASKIATSATTFE